MFDGGLTKNMHCIISRESMRGVSVRSGLTKSMHCIVPSEIGEVDLVFDMALSALYYTQ